MEKITIKKFVEEYSNRATEKLQEQYIKDTLEIIPYIPYVRKMTLAEQIVNMTSFDKTTGKLEIDSNVRVLFMFRVFIAEYTNLEFESEGYFEEYDLLKQSGAYNKVMEMLPDEDLSEFNSIINLTLADLIRNTTSTQAFVEKQLNKILNVVTEASDQLSLAVTTLDDDKIQKISQLSNGFFSKFAKRFSK